MDIVGGNLYDHFVKRHKSEGGKSGHLDSAVPVSRQLPMYVNIPPSTVQEVNTLLVKTGVSEANIGHQDNNQKVESPGESSSHNHKDFPVDAGLLQPTHEFDDVLGAVSYVLKEENSLS